MIKNIDKTNSYTTSQKKERRKLSRDRICMKKKQLMIKAMHFKTIFFLLCLLLFFFIPGRRQWCELTSIFPMIMTAGKCQNLKPNWALLELNPRYALENGHGRIWWNTDSSRSAKMPEFDKTHKQWDFLPLSFNLIETTSKPLTFHFYWYLTHNNCVYLVEYNIAVCVYNHIPKTLSIETITLG